MLGSLRDVGRSFVRGSGDGFVALRGRGDDVVGWMGPVVGVDLSLEGRTLICLRGAGSLACVRAWALRLWVFVS